MMYPTAERHSYLQFDSFGFFRNTCRRLISTAAQTPLHWHTFGQNVVLYLIWKFIVNLD